MTRIFGHYVAPEMIILWAIETLLCGATMQVLLYDGGHHDPATTAGAVVIALTIGLIAVAIGLYRRDTCLLVRRLAVNTAVAGVLAFPAVVLVGLAVGIDMRALVGRHDAMWPMQLLLAWVLLLTATRLLLSLAMRMDLVTRNVIIVGEGADAAPPMDARGDFLGRQTAHLLGMPGNGFVRLAGIVAAPETQAGAAALDPARLRARRVWALVTVGPEGRTLSTDAAQGCRAAGVRVMRDAEFLEQHVGRLDIAQLPPDWISEADGVPGSRAAAAVRRLGDIVISTAFLVFGLPLMLVTALLIRIDSPGPVFYRQVRVGLNGRPFTLVKFRSMRTDAEARGPTWASRRDPRVTRIGSFIRRTRIDELPQLIGVLRGEMSLIGPRPERPHFVETLADAIPFYRDRARVKPGLTGWAQVNFPYGASIEDARMKLSYDLYYVKHRSLFLDLLILISTIRVILFQEGAR